MKNIKKEALKIFTKLFAINDLWQLFCTLIAVLHLNQKIFGWFSESNFFSVFVIIFALPTLIRKLKSIML